MTAISQAFNSALLDFVWQGALAALVLQAGLAALRKRSAQSRYLASCAALAILALAPAVTTMVLYRSAAPVSVQPVNYGQLLDSAAAASAMPAAPAQWLQSLRAWALPLWSIGVCCFALRLVRGCRQISGLRASGRESDSALGETVERLASRLGMKGPVEVMISAIAESPSVVGWLRPVILLPAASLAGLTPEQLESVLAHELAHIRRHDYTVNVLQAVVETLLFYHPAVWWISGRIREERELCCDDMAVACCQDAVGYARALTELEKIRSGAREQFALAADGGSLLARVERLVGVEHPRARTSTATALLALLIGTACLALNSGWMKAQTKVEMGASEVRHREPVPYPESAWKAKVRGTVVLEVTLDMNSAVVDAKVLSGPMELRRAALQSVLQWRFVQSAAGGVRQVSIVFEPPKEMPETVTVTVLDSRVSTADGRVYRLHDRPEMENEVRALRSQVEELEAKRELTREREQLQALRKNQANRELTDSQRAELEQQLAGLQRETQRNMEELASAQLRYDVALARSPFNAEGSVVARIEMFGIEGELREKIAGRLPVKLGDTITHEIRERITETLNHSDPRVELHYYPMEEGKVALVIAAPESGIERRKVAPR